MNHEEYKDLLALEALHSLDGAEASLLHEHLATCQECCRELIELHDAAALLALSVDKIAPPETLRARILDSLKETNAFSHRETNGEANANSEPHRNKETGKVLPLRKGSNAGGEKASFSKSALWSGALAASLVAALIISLVFWQRNNARQEERASLSSRNGETQSDSERRAELNQSLPRSDETNAETPPSSSNNAAPSSNKNNEAPAQINNLPNRNLPNRNDNNDQQDKKTGQRKIIAPLANQPQVTESPVAESPVTESPITTTAPTTSVTDTRVVQFSGTEKAPQAHARMILDKSAGKITVTVSDLPPPAVGRAYQLWFIVKGRPIPGSVFVTGQEGRAMIQGQIPAGARDATAFAVTLEKPNGANKPSGAKYLLGSITAS